MVRLIALFAFFFLGTHLMAQKEAPLITVGYFAPYGVQIGGKLGVRLPLKTGDTMAGRKHARISTLSISPQVAHFVFPGTQRNTLLSTEFIYQIAKENKRFSPMTSFSLGYLLARQKQGGNVNLGSGDVADVIESLHYFAPTITVGFDIKPRRAIGYYMRAFYGREIGQQANSPLFGLELGTTFNLLKNN